MITTQQLTTQEHSWLPFNCLVKYSTKRRSLQLSLQEGSVVLYCPDKTPLSTIQTIINQHLDWVHTHQKKYQNQPTITPSRFDEDVLLDRVEIWSTTMNLFPKKIKFSNAKTRWGSRHTNGTIRLNRALLKAPLAIVDYVVIHELAHLKEMNHSKRFWTIVERHCPNYKQHRKWLNYYGDQLLKKE